MSKSEAPAKERKIARRRLVRLARVRKHGLQIALLAGRRLGEVPLEGVVIVGRGDLGHALGTGGAIDEIDRLRAVDTAALDDGARRVALHLTRKR